MQEVNFVAIGKIPDEFIFIHKNDLSQILNELKSDKVKCIAIDLITKRISDPVIIDRLLNVCPHDPVKLDDEREEINTLILKIMPERKIKRLIKLFDKIKLRG